MTRVMYVYNSPYTFLQPNRPSPHSAALARRRSCRLLSATCTDRTRFPPLPNSWAKIRDELITPFLDIELKYYDLGLEYR